MGIQIRRLFIIMSLIFVFCIFAHEIYCVYAEKKELANHAVIAEMLEEPITFDDASIENQMNEIQYWLSKRHVSNADRASLYVRENSLYELTNQMLNYYRSLGCALYYLDDGGSKDTAVNMYADLANFYLMNYSYERADEAIAAACHLRAPNNIEDLQIKSYFYRLLSMQYMNHGDYATAENYLNTSDALLSESDTNTYEVYYQAFNDILRAEIAAYRNDYDSVRKILKDYDGNEIFNSPYYANVVDRDFVIPYYCLRCIIDANDEKMDEMLADAEALHEVCGKYGYQKVEVNCLLMVHDQFLKDPDIELDSFAIELNNRIYETYSALTGLQSEEYTALVEAQIKDAMEGEVEKIADYRDEIHKWHLYMVYIWICLFIIGLVQIMSFHASKAKMEEHEERKAQKREELAEKEAELERTKTLLKKY